MIKVAASLLSIVPVQLAVAWAADATPVGGSEAVTIATLITQLGLSGIFFYQWRQERDLRIKRDEFLFQILDKQGPVLQSAISALEKVEASMAKQIDKDAFEGLVRDLRESVRDSREVANTLMDEVEARRTTRATTTRAKRGQ